ncbi:MAG: phosphodiester glycosidase family protein [Thermaurantiacus sp.]
MRIGRIRALPVAALLALAAPAAASGGGTLSGPVGAEACVGATQPCAIAPGLSYRLIRRTAPRLMQVHVAEIDMAEPGLEVRVTPADPTAGMEYRAKTTSRHLSDSGAVLAVNASYFLPFVGGSPGGQDFVPQPGQAANASGAVTAAGALVSPADSIDARVDSKICLAAGRALIAAGQACPEGFPEGVSAGPRLLRDGAAVPRPVFGRDGMFHGAVPLAEPPPESLSQPAPAGGGPRTALGVSADGRRLWLVVVDGRQPGHSEGASHDDLIALFQELGARDAMSLDGGGSATMVARGPGGPLVLNRPIHTRVPGRERPVANHIGVFSGPAPARGPGGLLPAAEERAVPRLPATLERIYGAPEARQGVAVDRDHFYAVVNTAIGKYRRSDGALVRRWAAPRGGLIRHLNSCTVVAAELLCANSNHPEVPMGNSVEWFSTRGLEHLRSHSLGMMDEGSLTFVEPLGDGWLLGMAHYSDATGVPFKPSEYSAIITMDRNWRRTGGWLIPRAIRARMAPQAASGGAIGPDGLLYLFGHSKPEMYVLARPVAGPELVHVATIDLDAAGQAFVFARGEGRRIFAIDRPTATVRVFSLPEVGSLPTGAATWP